MYILSREVLQWHHSHCLLPKDETLHSQYNILLQPNFNFSPLQNFYTVHFEAH